MYDLRAGDVIELAGRDWRSRLIALATLPTADWCAALAALALAWYAVGPLTGAAAGLAVPAALFARSRKLSHVALVVSHKGRLFLIESTTLSQRPCLISRKRAAGGQAHDPHLRIAEYDGRVWVRHLAPYWQLTEADSDRLTEVALDYVGTPYHYIGAALAGSRVLAWWQTGSARPIYAFCVQLAAHCLKHVERFPLGTSSASCNPTSFSRVLDRGECFERHTRLK